MFTYKPEVGDRVRFNGWTKEQVKWGNNHTPYMLIIGHEYTITGVEVHRSHTKVTIRGVCENMKFNSVHFSLVGHDSRFPGSVA